jgi:hypothetical protein
VSRLVAFSVAALFSVSAGVALATAQKKVAPVPYPEGYREWTHVKSMAIVSEEHPLHDAFGGLHHVYVNPKGRAAARGGGAYPDGSVLVFDLLAAHLEGGAYTEGERKFIGVMRKDAKAYAATGGWGYEAFKGDSRTERVVTDAAAQCYACHQAKAGRDYVFSEWRE